MLAKQMIYPYQKLFECEIELVRQSAIEIVDENTKRQQLIHRQKT